MITKDFDLELMSKLMPLDLDDEKLKSIIDIVFWAMEHVAEAFNKELK